MKPAIVLVHTLGAATQLVSTPVCASCALGLALAGAAPELDTGAAAAAGGFVVHDRPRRALSVWIPQLASATVCNVGAQDRAKMGGCEGGGS